MQSTPSKLWSTQQPWSTQQRFMEHSALGALSNFGAISNHFGATATKCGAISVISNCAANTTHNIQGAMSMSLQSKPASNTSPASFSGNTAIYSSISISSSLCGLVYYPIHNSLTCSTTDSQAQRLYLSSQVERRSQPSSTQPSSQPSQVDIPINAAVDMLHLDVIKR